MDELALTTADPERLAQQEADGNKHDAPPGVLDTYALVYASILLFLAPGALAVARLPFRTYSFAYVSLITFPFLLGLAFVFLTDSRDGLRTRLVRTAVLIPIVVLTGVTVLFTSSLLVIPISFFVKPQFHSETTWPAIALLVALAAPLLPALLRRLRAPFSTVRVVQAVVITLAVVLVSAVAYLSIIPARTIATMFRKDVMIYIVGGLVWYLPSFGIAAGIWRRVGLV